MYVILSPVSPPLPQPHGLLEVSLVHVEVAAGLIVLHVVGEVAPVMVGRLGDGGRVILGVVLDRAGGQAPGGCRHGQGRVAHNPLPGRGHR